MKKEENANTEQNAQGNVVIVAGILCGLLVWFFGFRPFLVDGASMYPSFNTAIAEETKDNIPIIKGDYLIIDIFSYLFRKDPERFDVVVFRSPIEPKRYLLKRIVGLPNEQVHLSGSNITITKADGTTLALNEPYINQEEIIVYKKQTVALGKNQYFLLGDNRTNSLDSRVWGSLEKDNIIGKVILRLYPFSEAGTYPGEYK